MIIIKFQSIPFRCAAQVTGARDTGSAGKMGITVQVSWSQAGTYADDE